MRSIALLMCIGHILAQEPSMTSFADDPTPSATRTTTQSIPAPSPVCTDVKGSKYANNLAGAQVLLTGVSDAASLDNQLESVFSSNLAYQTSLR